MLGFSAKTIRRDIASMPDDVRKMSLACPSDVPVMSLTEYGLKWLAEKHGIPFSGSSPDGSSGRQEEKQESENELVLSLLEQLRQKDIQIAEKDKQIAQLMEQVKIIKCFCKLSRCFLCQLRRGLFSSVYLGYMKRKSDGFAVALLLCF